jgi:hypothetical protein
MAGRSGRHGRVELVDELGELFDHAGVVFVGMVADEVDYIG